MNRTQISAVFLIAMTILFAMNISLASFIGFMIVLIVFACNAWRDNK